CDPLLCGPHHEHDLILRPMKFSNSHGPQLAGNRAVTSGQCGNSRPAECEQLAIDNRLGRQSMSVTSFKPEHITRQIEGGDLAPTVLVRLAGAYAAFENPVQILDPLVLAVDLSVASEGHNCPDHVDCSRWRGRGRRILWGGWTSDRCVSEHRLGPRLFD